MMKRKTATHCRASSSVSGSVVFIWSPRYRVQEIHREQILPPAPLTVKHHVHTVFESLAKSHDTAGAYGKSRCHRCFQCFYFLVVCMGRADLREIPSGSFQIAVSSASLRIPGLFSADPRSKGLRKNILRCSVSAFDPADALADLIQLLIRQTLAGCHDGVPQHALLVVVFCFHRRISSVGSRS